MPARAAVEEVHGAGATLAGKLDTRDLIAQLERQVEACRHAAAASRYFVGGFGEALTACGEGEGAAIAAGTLGANDESFETSIAIKACAQAKGLITRAVADHLKLTAARELTQGSREGAGLAVVIDAVAQPHDVEAVLAGEDARELLYELGALGGEGLRLQGGSGRARRAGCLDAQRGRLGAGSRRRDDNGAIGAFGL